MDKNLNELSALYMQNIAEQGPEEQQARVAQIVKAVRYRARKEGVELSKAYNDYIGSVQATSTERQAVKEKLGLTGGAAHKEEVEYVEESGVGYEAGKPAEKLGAVAGISKSEQEAARERIKAKMAAKKAAKKVVESSYDPMDDDEVDHDEAEENRGVSGKNNPKGGKALGKKKKVVSKKEVSNWREEFIFEVDEPETDTESEKQIKEKKVNNKVVINPPMKEAFEEIGGTILEVVEVEEGIGMTMAKAMGNPPALSARMRVKQALIKREIDKNTEKNKMKKYSGKAKVEEEMGSAANTQMQNVQRRQLQLDRKKLEIRKKLMSQKQQSPADSVVSSEEVEIDKENVNEIFGLGGKSAKDRLANSDYMKKKNKEADEKAIQNLRDMMSKDPERQKRPSRINNEEVEQVDEKLNLKKADMGDVIKDFYKSDAPQFKGRSKEKRREMAIAAKLTAERGGRRLGEGATEAPMTPQELALQKRKTMLDQMIAKKRQQALQKQKEV